MSLKHLLYIFRIRKIANKIPKNVKSLVFGATTNCRLDYANALNLVVGGGEGGLQKN